MNNEEIIEVNKIYKKIGLGLSKVIIRKDDKNVIISDFHLGNVLRDGILIGYRKALATKDKNSNEFHPNKKYCEAECCKKQLSEKDKEIEKQKAEYLAFMKDICPFIMPSSVRIKVCQEISQLGVLE